MVVDGSNVSLWHYNSNNFKKVNIESKIEKITSTGIYLRGFDEKDAYAYTLNEFYVIGNKLYVLNDANEVCELNADLSIGAILDGAVYNTYSQISETNGSIINEKIFNKAYAKVFKSDPKLIDTIINMNLKDMAKLTHGNADILSTFAESIQTDLRLIAAYFLNLAEEGKYE